MFVNNAQNICWEFIAGIDIERGMDTAHHMALVSRYKEQNVEQVMGISHCNGSRLLCKTILEKSARELAIMGLLSVRYWKPFYLNMNYLP